MIVVTQITIKGISISNKLSTSKYSSILWVKVSYSIQRNQP